MTDVAVVHPDTGEVVNVDQANLAQAINEDFRPATKDEIQVQKRHQEYGGVGGAAIATGLGAARSYVPGFDVAASAFGAGEIVKNYQEENPLASGAGEILGFALPGSGLAKLAGKAGALAAGAARAPSFMGRVGQAAVKLGVEGAILGANTGVNDVSLHPELDGSHILTSAAMGGAIGGLLGGSSGVVVEGALAAGRGAVSLAKKIPGAIDKLPLPSSARLEEMSNEQAWRSTYASKPFTEKAARLGGEAEVGKVLKEVGVIREADGTLGNVLHPSEILERTDEAMNRIGQPSVMGQ